MVANAAIVIYQSFLDSELWNLCQQPSTESSTATVDNFDRQMAVNARSTMLCYKHAANQMIAQGRGGRIIGAQISSYPSPRHVLI
jgi:NAD(P)-dependent dehydrogenase (short-subunit alcohol dehydrogenase family)